MATDHLSRTGQAAIRQRQHQQQHHLQLHDDHGEQSESCDESSFSADFGSMQDVGSGSGARQDVGACSRNQRKLKATGGGRIISRWSRVRAKFFRRKKPSIEPTRPVQPSGGSCQFPQGRNIDATTLQPEEILQETVDKPRFFGDAASYLATGIDLTANPGMAAGSIPFDRQHGQSGSLSHKYQPKVFEDIIGQEMIVKALTSAIQNKRVSSLYLFHGPSGTGKTSTAKIFAMALNCLSVSLSKPCWGCTGCSRSLYTADLCSGNRNSGFANIETLLHSTLFKHTFLGLMVFILDECHSVSAESWGKLLDTIQQDKGCSVSFIIIAEDANTVPKSVLSRCQKFCFAKLMDTDILVKLAGIAAQERIEISKNALKLVAKIVEGNLREAENILDQLALLGQPITASMVQKLAGLVPHDKLVQVLESALHGDSIEALRNIKDLFMYCIEPRALVLQLAAVITEVFPSRSYSPTPTAIPENKTSLQVQALIRYVEPERLCRALRILIETEKQLRTFSCNHATWVTSALLEISSNSSSSHVPTSFSLHRDLHPADNTADAETGPSILTDNSGIRHNRSNQPTSVQSDNHVDKISTMIKNNDMEEVWRGVIERIQDKSLQVFLHRQMKLISLTVSRANAIVHVMLKHAEQKVGFEIHEESISNNLKAAFGCPVVVNISHEPTQLGVMPRNFFEKQVPGPSHSGQVETQVFEPSEPSRDSDNGGQLLRRSASQRSPINFGSSRFTGLQNGGHMSGRRTRLNWTGQENYIAEELPTLSCHLNQARKTKTLLGPEMGLFGRDQSHGKNSIARGTEPWNRLASISSIPRTDASIEPYSQDLLFEAANTDRKRGSRKAQVYKDLVKINPDSPNMRYMGLERSWSCTERFC